MKRFVCGLSLACVALSLAAPPAAAKGPTEATIEGPGIGETKLGLAPGGEWELELASIAETAFFPGVFGPPGVLEVEGEPSGPLGPRYTITYRVPMGDEVDRVVQYVYPFAAGGGYTFTPEGQPVLGDRTTGGWIRAPKELKAVLGDLGATSTADPTSAAVGEGAARSSSLVLIGASAAALTIATGWLLFARRRRSGAVADAGIAAT